MKCLLDEGLIQTKVQELSLKIRKDYASHSLVVVGVLKGSFIFMSDLVRELDGLDITCDFLRVSSYEGQKSRGQVHLDFDLTQSIEGKHVLLIEDIVDSGTTLEFLKAHLTHKKPLSIRVVTLLYKEEIKPHLKSQLDYIGFTIPNVFVVGYGMDQDGQYRHLRNIYVLGDSA